MNVSPAQTALLTPKEIALGRAVLDPVDFQVGILKRTLWSKQEQIALASANISSTAVKGCHACGKTFTVAGSALHHLAKYKTSKVITISPTLRQVKLMWQEIEAARQASSIRFPQCSTTELRITQERYGIGFSSSKGVNAQGFHASNVLIITDESPGIGGDIWDAIEGARSGGSVRIIKLGNPTVPSGAFYDDFHGRNRLHTNRITISAFDTPNLAGLTLESLLALPDEELDVVHVPNLIRRRWVREMYTKWGPNNPRFQSRVLGEFPTQSQWSVFSLAWIEQASREATDEELARAEERRPFWIQVGVDVAAGGDDETACCARIGGSGIVIKTAAYSSPDARGEVTRFISDVRKQYPQARIIVAVDKVGVGFHMGTYLADQGLEVFGFAAGGLAMDAERYVNAKAEAYWALREHMEMGTLRNVVDEDTRAQLSDILYRETPAGRVEIEPKEKARKRGAHSPDRAEALVLAFCRCVPREQSVVMDA